MIALRNSLIVAVLVLGAFVVGYFMLQKTTVPDFTLGAVSSPDIPSLYLKWGGVATWKAATAMNSASTTLCALRSPAGTSTLESIIADVDVATSTALVVTLSQNGTTDVPPSASSTSISDFSIAASAKSTLINASSTIIAPNKWVIVTAKGADPVRVGGSCQATFQEVVPN